MDTKNKPQGRPYVTKGSKFLLWGISEKVCIQQTKTIKAHSD
jgi:hypothetical protein